jgi:hypothetical protein
MKRMLVGGLAALAAALGMACAASGYAAYHADGQGLNHVAVEAHGHGGSGGGGGGSGGGGGGPGGGGGSGGDGGHHGGGYVPNEPRYGGGQVPGGGQFDCLSGGHCQ